MAPETLIFSTSSEVEVFAGDEVLVERTSGQDTMAFIQIAERRGPTASVFLTLDEAKALENQLHALIADAESRS